MSEHDNTNSGVIFMPYEDQSLTGQGKLNIEGRDSRVVIVKERLKRDGDIEMEVYQKVGVLFHNDQKGNDKAPKYSGPLDQFSDLKIAAWPGEKDGRRYMSLKVSEKENRSGEGGGARYNDRGEERRDTRSDNRRDDRGGYDRGRDEGRSRAQGGRDDGRNQRDQQDRRRQRDLDDEIPF